MNVSMLQRNPDRLKAAVGMQPDNSLVALQPCKLYIPERFADRKLAYIGTELRIVGIFAITVEDKYYAVSTVNAMMQITPTSTNLVDIDGDTYYEFGFDKGSVITPNLELPLDDTLPYAIYDEIIAKGHTPWYLDYDDRGKLFSSAELHGGVTLAANNIPLEIMAATTTRIDKDRTKYYRHSDSVGTTPFVGVFIPLRSIIYGATDTVAKIIGSYMDDGLTSALVNPSEKTETVESLLRA